MMKNILPLLIALLIMGCDTGEEKSPEDDQLNVQSSNIPDSLTLNLSESFARIDSAFGQTIYVPVYSHIYQLDHRKTFNLTATLSIRNTDLRHSFILTKVLYYDSEGNLVKNYLENSKTIEPLASTSFVVEENDLRGGVGANFIVKWTSEKTVYPPVVEAIMISTSQQQGISFVSVGRVLEEAKASVD